MAYRHSVTTFVDILGFADLVAGGDGSFDEVVEKLDAIGATAARPLEAADTMTTTVSFSDSVIRARPLGSGTAYDALLHEIQELAAAQWQLLEFGMLIRGGTTIGHVSVEDGRAFGPAFVRAYRLESSLAVSPRIIIDPMVIQSIRADLRRATTGAGKTELISELRNHIRQGDDGLWYVDYVNSVWITTADRSYMRTALTDMKSFIVREARKFEDKPLILPKYLWLVRYHNDSVYRLLRENPELKITARDVPASDGFLKPPRRSRPA